jgi:predicted RNase H-like HicB family nuclease
MNYPIVIHKDRGSDYGVTVPDLPGCFTAGRTLDEALAMAKEAIELHLEGMIEQGEAVPRPGAVEDYSSDPEYKGGGLDRTGGPAPEGQADQRQHPRARAGRRGPVCRG